MEKRKYYQPEIETMPVDQIKKLQSEKLVRQVQQTVGIGLDRTKVALIG